jgi:6-phosphogluconolactonase (cycloisomerase 2 family)
MEQKLIFISKLTRQDKYLFVKLSDGDKFICDAFTWDKDSDSGKTLLVVNVRDEQLRHCYIQSLDEEDIVSVEEYIKP